MAKYSAIIKNGTVFDGKNNSPQKTDVGISGDEISHIGDLRNEQAEIVIDASGQYVSPGFIDLTNHSDTHWTLFSSPAQESLVSQGITTIIGGNCGSSLAPFLGDSSAKEIEKWIDSSSLNINWQTVGEFLAEMDKHKLGVNFGTLVGFNTIRHAVIGSSQRKNAIKFLLKSSLDEGALGLSTHFGLSDSGLFSDDEVADIFKILSANGSFAKHHLEDEGADILPAVSMLIGLARSSRSRMHISHFKSVGRSSWGSFPGALNMARNARGEGMKITYDFFPYTKTGSSLMMLLPAWFRKYSRDEVKKILAEKNGAKRTDLLDYLKKITLHYDRIIIASAIADFEQTGKTIKEISDNSGLSPEEAILELLGANDLRVSIFNEVISEENLDLVAKDDYSAVSSDGVGYGQKTSAGIASKDLPHPRSFGSFPRALDLFVKKKELLPWESMIYKMTGLPASISGIANRGVLEKNKKADIVVFDPLEISDQASYEDPFKYCVGMKHVFINGDEVLSAGKFTGKMPGAVIRKK